MSFQALLLLPHDGNKATGTVVKSRQAKSLFIVHTIGMNSWL